MEGTLNMNTLNLQKLTVEEINVLQQTHFKNWELSEDRKILSMLINFKGNLKAMSFLNALMFQANCRNHHPDIHMTFNTVKVSWTTHDADGLSQKDKELVEVTNQLISLL